MRSEELAKLTRVVHKHKVKVSTCLLYTSDAADE